MKPIKNNLEAYKLLASRYTLNLETGVFTSNRTGRENQYPDKHGYISIESSFKGKRVRVKGHRLAWFIYYGEMPPTLVDHINGDRADNRKCNLQLLSHRANIAKGWKDIGGTYSQWTGVTWNKANSKWVSAIRLKGSTKYLGSFDNQFVAACAYQNALTAHLSEARKNVNL